MLLTVAICTWNRAALLAQTLERLTRLERPATPWELLVVNNNCTDHTDAVLDSFRGRLPLRPVFEGASGHSHARNAAVRHAHGDYLVWTDDDALVDTTWLRAYERAIRRWPGAAVFGGPVRPKFEGTPPAWLEAIASEAEVQSAFAGRELGADPIELNGEDKSPYGVNFVVRMLEQRQFPYNPDLGRRHNAGALCEETNLVKAIFAAGGTGWWVPDARVEHWIPIQRQTLTYLRHYYTLRGRSYPTVYPRTTPMLWGRPRWMWRQAVQAEVSYRLARVSGHPHRWLKPFIKASVLWGVLTSPRTPTNPPRSLSRYQRPLARTWARLTERPHQNIPLISATRHGDLAAVTRLLASGVPVNAQDSSGCSALHRAVSLGYEEIAASLLAHGANPHLVDHKGRSACAGSTTPPDILHGIRQRYHRLPMRAGTAGAPLLPSASARAQGWAADLERRGIIKITGLLTPEALTSLRTDFARFIQALDERIARGKADHKHYDEEEHWWPNDQAYVSNNAFKYSPDLARLCCHDDLIACARLFLGRTPFIQRGVAMRYLPIASRDNDMFGWHHDMEERRFKMMILLTDVEPGGQHMSYILGSHRLFHPYAMFLKSSCGIEYCRKHLPAVETYDATGKAGDIFLFDSNGGHRGNRSDAAATRDAFFVEYSADHSELWGGDIDPGVGEELARLEHNPFARLLTVQKKWTLPVTRHAPSWVENLSRLERWL
ncbi:MAG: glycosyltransferase [Vicinamibacterales bacterium]